MSVELIAIIALTILICILFLFVFLRDQYVNRKLKLYERIIEEINRDNHTISKKLEKVSSKDEIDLEAMEVQIKTDIKDEVQKSLMPLVESIKEIESVMLSFQNEQISRIDALEDGKKRVNFVPPNMVDSNEKLIISQYKDGKSEAMIAKDLRIIYD